MVNVSLNVLHSFSPPSLHPSLLSDPETDFSSVTLPVITAGLGIT